MVERDEDVRKAVLGEILNNRYAPLFSLNLKKTTPGEIDKKMADAYGMAGETRHRAVRFFLSAAEYVGVELSPLLGTGKKANGSASQQSGKRRAIRRKQVVSVMDGNAEPAQAKGTSKTVRLKSGGTLMLSATLDLFSLNTADRQWIFKLIDMMETYEQPPLGPEQAV